MLKTFLIWGRVLLAAAIVLLAAAQSYAASIGRFQFVIGEVVVTDASGRTRTAAKGDELNEGDTIGTAALASAQLRMVDGAFVAVRPESKLKFDQYRYSGKEDGTERGLISLLVGGFRAVTGVIGRTNHANYAINTPTATIGIRGTDHETVHIPAPGENGDSIKPVAGTWPLPSVMLGQAVSAEDLRAAVRLAQAYDTQSDVDVPFLLALEGPAGKPTIARLSGPSGTYNKVNSGATSMTTQAGTTFINPNQVGYAASRTVAAVILPKVPEFFKATGNPGDRRQQQAGQGGGSQGQQSSGGGSDSGFRNDVVDAPGINTAGGSFTQTLIPFTIPVIVQPPLPPALPPVSTVVEGTLVIPSQAPTLSATTAGPSTVLTAYTFSNGSCSFCTHTDRFIVDNAANPSPFFAATPNLLSDAAGNLLSASNDSMFGDDNHAVLFAGGTANPSAPILAANGVTLGWRDVSPGLTVSGTNIFGSSSSCFGTIGCAVPALPVTAGMAWVRGPEQFPFYLSDASVMLPASATYTLSNSTAPRDQNGVAGTLIGSTLNVNFSRQYVNFAMDATTGAGAWHAAANQIKLNGGDFFASTNFGTTYTTDPGVTVTNDHGSSILSVTLNGGTNTFGNISGSLMGLGVGAAGVVYSLGAFVSIVPYSVSGALAFSGPAQSINTSYQLIALASGMNPAGTIDDSENTRIQGGFVAPSRTQFVNNLPVAVDSQLAVAVTPSCTPACSTYVNDIPVIYAVTGATGVPSIGTATIVDSGIDAATGIAWGRYTGGTVGVTDRITGASLGAINLGSTSVHFAVTPSQSGPTVLPISGTVAYTMVGATHPTDNFGNVGTLNSASLTANFTAQTVNTAVNATVGANNFVASAANVPIQGAVFQAQKGGGSSNNLSVTATGATTTSGQLVGAFTGPTGTGAALFYSLNKNGNILNNASAVTVSGVAAFKR